MDFKLTPRDFPKSVIRQYAWCGEDEEIQFDGVEVNGYLLTTLNGSIRVWETVDKDISILSIVLPFIRSQREKKRLNARLVELTEWADNARLEQLKEWGRRERGNETQSPCVSSPSQ